MEIIDVTTLSRMDA